MKYTLRCPDCKTVFVFSEENDDYGICPNCKWFFDICGDFATKYLDKIDEIHVKTEEENFDLIWKAIDKEVKKMLPEHPSMYWARSFTKWKKEFSHYLESRFTQVPQTILVAVDDLVKNIDFQKVADFQQMKAKECKIGNIVLDGRKIPVYLGDYAVSAYQKNRDAIVLPYNTPAEEMLPLLIHEIEHVIDKKITSPTWRGASKDYDVNKETYAKEPVEFDAFGTEYATAIREKFASVDLNGKMEIIHHLKQWLREGGETPLFNPEIVNIWKTKPTLYRRFQQRVYNLVQDLEKTIKP